MRRLIQIATWLYPASWRERYGAEFEALLEDVKPVGRDVWDVVRGALIMQMTAWNFGRVTAGCGLAGLIVAGAVAYIVPDSYVSTAVMRIAPMTRAEGTSQGAVNSQMQQRLQQMKAEVLSRSSLTAIVTRPEFDLYHRERTRIPLEDVIQDMRNKIRIQPVGTRANPPATAFTISYEYPNNFKAQAVVRELVTKFNAVNVTQQSEVAQNLEILDPASLPDKPSSPNRVAMLLLGLMAGLLLGLIAALVLAWPKRTITIVAFGIGGCALMAAVSFLIPNRYVSTAVLRTDRAAAPVEQLFDPDLLARVVAAQTVVKSVEELRQHLTIRRVDMPGSEARVFAVSFQSGDRFGAQSIVRQVISEAIRKQTPAPPLQVLDPPSYPQRSSPNRLTISMLGLLGGLVLGSVSMRLKRMPATA